MAADPHDGVRPAEAGSAPPRSRRRRWGRGFLLALFLVGLLVGAAVTALVRSGAGQRFLLDAALARVQGALAGSLTVEEVHSASLLRGVVLLGVRLDAEGGRRFLEADSLRVRYSVFSMLGAPPRVAALTIYGPHVEISPMPGEDDLNVARLVAPRDAAPGEAGQNGLGISFGSVRIVGGTLEVLTPVEGEPPPRVLAVPTPDGTGTLRRLALEDVDLLLEDVTVAGSEALLTARLSQISLDLHMLDEPLRLVHAEGSVRFDSAGLAVEDAAFHLPASILAGSLRLGPGEAPGEGWGVGLDVRTRGPASLSDLAWLEPRLPEGTLTGGVSLATGDAVVVRIQGVRVELEESYVNVNGVIRLDEGVLFQGLEIRAAPLALAHVAPWTERKLPLDGWLSGNLRLDGRPAALSTIGRVTLVPTGHGGRATTADVRGTLHLAGDRGVTNLRLALDPLNLSLVGALQPALALQGPGSARVEASGRLSSGVRLSADVRHGDAESGDSRVLVQGTVRRERGGRWDVDIESEFAPLDFRLVSQVMPRVSGRGSLTGWVSAEGSLADLFVSGELASDGGRLTVEALLDLERAGYGYRLDASVEELDLAGAVPSLPGPFRWTGRLQVEGRGVAADSAEATGSLWARGSRVAGLQVDTVAASFHLAGGTLTVDSLTGRVGGFQVDGAGNVGLAEDASGELRLAFSTGNLMGIRPLLMGETVMARDTLSVIERQLLRLEGVDADTLPLLAEVAMSGTLDGDLVLSGSLSRLGLKGGVRLRDGVYGAERVGFADVHLDGHDLMGQGRRLDVAVEAHDVMAFGRAFSSLEGIIGVDGRSGDAELKAEQSTGDRYAAAGTFAFDGHGGGEVGVLRAMLDVDSMAWNLAKPTVIAWDSVSVTMHDVEIARAGGDPMRITADGTLAWGGTSDLRVTGEGVRLDLLARIAQWQGTEPGGRADLTLAVTGEAEDPAIDVEIRVRDPRWGDLALTDLSARVRYADRAAEVDVTALEEDRRVFRAVGTVPVDLALRTQGGRVLDRPMDLRVEADSLDAALVLSTIEALEDVEGMVSGDFRVRGTLNRPEPSGVLTLDGAGWSIEALGVRHTGVSGTLTLNPDRSLDVAVDVRAVGSSSVRGKIVLDPLADARLDLTVAFQGFQAVSRRDMAGLMSGEVRLLGSYRAPRVEGALTVDQGTLFLEEFVRSAEVVDLTDPRIFQVVDTTALASRPLLDGIRNPFLQTLRVDVDLSVPRDTWLRSEQMNVEIGGDLLVRYDRVSRDVVMVGELQALRGSYTVLGRRFDVEGGTVGFIGTPGVNPRLAIQAVSRIRRVEGDPLDVTATVEGTLVQPRVTLSSQDQGIAESDLVSYLIFGRPSSELATGQEAWLGGAAGSLVGAATGAGVTFVSGTLAARLGAALSQQIGLDYLSITQAGDFGVMSGSVGGSLAGTQVEVGQYVGDRVFFMVILRPPGGQNNAQSILGGARVEVALTDDYNVQAFWEDRFLRSRVGSFGDLGFQASQVVGIFLFREWGY